MRLSILSGLFAATALVCIAAAGPAIADGSAANASFWQIPADPGAISLTIQGQAAPVLTRVTDATIFSGICQDCSLPLDFKSGQSGKPCAVCGCSVNNATCIAGKPVKDGTWQSMMKALPQGVGLTATFVDPTKPELGLKKLTVNLRSVILPVTGLDALTPDQLLALVKPLGGTKAELLDSGKILSITLKVDYTADKAAKLVKSIAAANGKISVPAV